MAPTTSCPLTCPALWQQFPTAGTDHCYLFPPKPVPFTDFWSYDKYCKSFHPSAYLVSVNTNQEYSTGCTKAFTYLLTYAVGIFYVWLGAYYQNGAWHWLDGSPWGSYMQYVQNPLIPPANGSCLFVDPRTTLGSWQYRPCSDAQGAAVCEMSPVPDCSGTTRPPPTTLAYAPPNCNEPRTADFVPQLQKGYMAVAEIMTIPGMDTNSCATACMYYDGCASFDISTSGDCRLLDSSVVGTCTQVEIDDTYQHYDLIAMV